ncbi:membrane protein insertase YidC [Streptomyces sp. NPDC048629]|uniref:YidC/Oxa1 family membrane protein insertase n=1 Tax=Streptomyces sp. NPDC048629 TaxID=3154824 RepID=UPI003440889F
MSVFASLFEHFADLFQPLFGSASTAAAIVLFTALVRLALHPLARAAARGQKARVRLAPEMAELRTRHAKNPERLQKEVLALHKRENVSPLAGCLPSVLQLPAFFLLFHLFSGERLAGHSLFAAPLGGHWSEALAHGGPFGPAGLVYVALFAVVAAVATFTYRRAKRDASLTEAVPGPAAAGVARVLPLLSYGTLITVAVVPLAAALYVVTSTLWTAVERAFLYRDVKRGAKPHTSSGSSPDTYPDAQAATAR